jgi:hypothetical protein
MNLLTPLNGTFLVLHLAILVVIVFGLIDSLLHPDAAYRGAGKLIKAQWVGILAVALLFSWFGLFSIIGLVAALIYLLDVRPAVRGISGSGGRGGSSSSGPYGPW